MNQGNHSGKHLNNTPMPALIDALPDDKNPLTFLYMTFRHTVLLSYKTEICNDFVHTAYKNNYK